MSNCHSNKLNYNNTPFGYTTDIIFCVLSEDPALYYKEIYVVLGHTKRPHRLLPGEPHVIKASVVKQHHKYGHDGANVHDNDIALVKLTKPVKFERAIQPICLPMISNVQ